MSKCWLSEAMCGVEGCTEDSVTLKGWEGKMRSEELGKEMGADLQGGLRELCGYIPYYRRGKMIEIGTFIGESTKIFEEYFEEVTTVDPWDTDWLSDSLGHEVTEEWLEQEFKKNCKEAKHIKLPSLMASVRFQANEFDFVYIDGWHQLLPCVIDIMSWLPKVMGDGWIGGHDYHTNKSCVIPAVMMTLGKPDKVFSDTSWIKRL